MVLVSVSQGKPELSLKGSMYGALAGITAILGGWFYLYAARESDIASVVIITALYPVLTIFLARALLGESITSRQLLSLALAIAAILVLTTSPAKQ